jgi:adenine phosphoribosyltransferase
VNVKVALELIREIPDFPKPGIIFQDITPLLAHSEAFALVIDQMATAGQGFDSVAGMEARGFIFASAIANRTSKGFIPIRKSGKLPYDTYSENYGLEYGTDTLEIHKDACASGNNVLVIDDVLATGGTACAAIRLIEKTGASVTSIAFVIEISALNGRAKIQEHFPSMQITSLKII